MAITTIPVLSNIARTPLIIAGEVDKYTSLLNKYTTLTTVGFQTFTSTSSGVTYNTVSDGGEAELMVILANAINANSTNPCIFTAEHFNSIKTTLEAGAGSGVNTDLFQGDPKSVFSKKVVPTEITISTGFASGWSGDIKYRINQEGLKTLVLSVEKTTDLTTTAETIATIPAIASTYPFGCSTISSLWTGSFATRVQGAMCEIRVDTSGNIKITSIGSVTATAKAINGTLMSYY